MKLRALTVVYIAGVLMLSTTCGCGPSQAGSQSASDSSSAPKDCCCVTDENPETAKPGDSQGPSQKEVTVAVADRAAFDEVVAKHKGKVVLVDFWATWCQPCKEQFPHSVEMSKKFDSAEFAVVSVSMDEPDDKESVLSFLTEHQAAFDNLISKYGVGEEGFDAFEIGGGGVPHYKIYDRSGKLRHTANSNEGIEQVVKQLLDEE